MRCRLRAAAFPAIRVCRATSARHRAAVGMSETAGSVLVVVSEETGAISVAIGGMLKRHLSPEILQKMLERAARR